MNEVALEALNVFARIAGAIFGIGAGLFLCFLLYVLAVIAEDIFLG